MRLRVVQRVRKTTRMVPVEGHPTKVRIEQTAEADSFDLQYRENDDDPWVSVPIVVEEISDEKEH